MAIDEKSLNFCSKKHKKWIQMKTYTRYLRSEEILFFSGAILKSKKQERRKLRWWSGNDEFTSGRSGKIRLDDSSFVSFSRFSDVKLLLKWIVKMHQNFYWVLISTSMKWKFLKLPVSPVSLELLAITTCV